MPTSGATNGAPEALGRELDALQRCAQVLLDVERQRPQRRDVQHPGAVRPLVGTGRRGEAVDRSKERRQRLAGSGRGADQRVFTGGDVRPAQHLWRCGFGERRREPFPNGGRESLQNRVGSDGPTLPSERSNDPRTRRGPPCPGHGGPRSSDVSRRWSRSCRPCRHRSGPCPCRRSSARERPRSTRCRRRRST